MNKKQILRLSALLLLLVSYGLLQLTKVTLPAADYEPKLAAAQQAKSCFDAIKELKVQRGLSIDTASDINETGMIGLDYSFITTTIGNLESKRTSTNPNMAAVVVDMFTELGLEPGDQIAINCSGSFPALNIAVLCAAQQLQLQPFLISSFGASTHGANDPELTWLDMEHHLYERGLISHCSDLYSIGGMEDIGKEMDPALQETIVNRISGYGYELFYDEDLIHNVRTRYEIYCSQGDVKCFVNVGGNDASFGDSNIMVHADGGILTALPEKDNSTGLVQLFLKDGIPVVHLLNMKSLVTEYGLPIDPVPLPSPGEGGVYFEAGYRTWLAWASLAAAFAALWLSREKRSR